jgi:hypothetical protein
MRCTNGCCNAPHGIHSRLISSSMLNKSDCWPPLTDFSSHTKASRLAFVLPSWGPSSTWCANGLHDAPWGIHSGLLSSSTLNEPDCWPLLVASSSHTKPTQVGFVLSSHILKEGSLSKWFAKCKETTLDSISPIRFMNQIVDNPMRSWGSHIRAIQVRFVLSTNIVRKDLCKNDAPVAATLRHKGTTPPDSFSLIHSMNQIV